MKTEEQTKKDFEYPEELIVLLRHGDTRALLMRVVYFVKPAQIYIDKEGNLYKPDVDRTGTFINLTMRCLKDEAAPGYPVATDFLVNVMGGFMSMFGRVSSDSYRRVEFTEGPSRLSREVCTVFRTKLAAHREWYRILMHERETIYDAIGELEKWFKTHEASPVEDTVEKADDS